jgi:hypothetical protein
LLAAAAAEDLILQLPEAKMFQSYQMCLLKMKK